MSISRPGSQEKKESKISELQSQMKISNKFDSLRSCYEEMKSCLALPKDINLLWERFHSFYIGQGHFEGRYQLDGDKRKISLNDPRQVYYYYDYDKSLALAGLLAFSYKGTRKVELMNHFNWAFGWGGWTWYTHEFNEFVNKGSREGFYLLASILVGLAYGDYWEELDAFLDSTEFKFYDNQLLIRRAPNPLYELVKYAFKAALWAENYELIDKLIEKYSSFLDKHQISSIISDRINAVDSFERQRIIFFLSQNHNLLSKALKENLIKKFKISDTSLTIEEIQSQVNIKIFIQDFLYFYLSEQWLNGIKAVQNIVFDYLHASEEEKIIPKFLATTKRKTITQTDIDFHDMQHRLTTELDSSSNMPISDIKKINEIKTSLLYTRHQDELKEVVLLAWAKVDPTSTLYKPLTNMMLITTDREIKQFHEKKDLMHKIYQKINDLSHRGFKDKQNNFNDLLKDFKQLNLDDEKAISVFKQKVNQIKMSKKLKTFSYDGLGKIPAFFRQISPLSTNTLTDSQLLCEEIIDFLRGRSQKISSTTKSLDNYSLADPISKHFSFG